VQLREVLCLSCLARDGAGHFAGFVISPSDKSGGNVGARLFRCSVARISPGAYLVVSGGSHPAVKDPVGRASVYVTYNGRTSGGPDYYYGPFANVVPSSVGIFALNSQGTGPGVFTALDGSVNDLVKTAKAGDVLTL